MRHFSGTGSCRLSSAPVVSPRFHPHSVVAAATVPLGVLNTRGAAISESICGVPVAWFPTISRDLAVTPTRRFRISRRFRSFSSLHPVAASAPRLCRHFRFALGLRCRCLRRLPVVLRIVHFSRHPQVMQQHRQLPRHRHHRPLLRSLPPFRLLQSPCPHFRRMQCAPCTNRLRSSPSPALLIPSSGWLSPLSRCFRVNPKYGPTSRLCANRSASSSVNTYVTPISTPTPYTCFSNFTSG